MDVYYNYNSKYHFELPGIDIHVMYFNANKQASHKCGVTTTTITNLIVIYRHYRQLI